MKKPAVSVYFRDSGFFSTSSARLSGRFRTTQKARSAFVVVLPTPVESRRRFQHLMLCVKVSCVGVCEDHCGYGCFWFHHEFFGQNNSVLFRSDEAEEFGLVF